MILSAIIVAAGNGSRMGSDLPKQFILLEDKPILIETISRFLTYKAIYKIVVVLPSQDFDHWCSIVDRYIVSENIIKIKGGSSRTESVHKGLSTLENDDIVLIHDGVRPFVTHNLIERVVAGCKISGGAVPAVKVIDSIRKIVSNDSITIDREPLRSVQTPQGFLLKPIKEAYKAASNHHNIIFTDDASVYEWSGRKITIVEGEYSNIKITTPYDLIIGKAIFDGLIRKP